MIYDVLIIGAGVTGSAVARELSRYKLKIAVLEKEEDVCCGTSKANSAIIHAGFDAERGTMMAKMNVRGNAMMDQLCSDLDIPFRRNGAMVVCTDPESVGVLEELRDRGLANGVRADSMEILDRDRALELEPNLVDDVVAAFYAKTSGIICPFILNIALAENANVNGADFFFNTKAEELKRTEEPGTGGAVWNVGTNTGTYTAKYVVNAAGVYADVIHNMVSERKIHITPRRGDYCLMDKECGGHVTRTVFSTPTKLGKGLLVSPTIHGNLIVGPTAKDIDDKEGTNTTQEEIGELIEKAAKRVKNVPLRSVITSFAGLRAHEDGFDFIIGEAEDAPCFIDCAGIESPGLSSCPAIGEYVGGMLREKLGAEEKEDWIPTRKGILHPSGLSFEERNELIKREPAYGRVICRCESVTEGEIIDAIRRPLGAKTLDGVKRRVRAGMGRCQSGFCSPRVMEILQRELGLTMEEITKSGADSVLVCEKTKGEYK